MKTITGDEFFKSLKITYCGEECNVQAQAQAQAQPQEEEEETNPFPKWATWIAYIVTLVIIIGIIRVYATKKRNIRDDFGRIKGKYDSIIAPNITYIVAGLHILHIESVKKYAIWLYDPNNLF